MAKKDDPPEFPSPFEDDTPETQGAEAEGAEGTEGGEGAEEWEPPPREVWEATQRDLQAAQERERRAAENAEQTQRMLAQVLGGQQSAQPGAQPGQPEPETPPIDLSGMPDPVSERDRYGQWLGEQLSRAEKRALERANQVQQRVESTSRADRLFNGFCEQYPTMRDKRPVVESAAVAAGLTGNEPESVIYEKTAETLKSWGLPVEGEAKPATDPAKSTAVGGPSSGTPRRRKTAEPEPKDLVDELASQQVKLGIM